MGSFLAAVIMVEKETKTKEAFNLTAEKKFSVFVEIVIIFLTPLSSLGHRESSTELICIAGDLVLLFVSLFQINLQYMPQNTIAFS